MKVFVIHYKKLVERKQHIENQFKLYNITDYEFVEIDRDELSSQDISIFRDDYSKAQIAILLSHFYVYKQIANHHESALIFEDDIVLDDQFNSKLMCYIKEMPTDYDMLFIGDGCGLHISEGKLIPGKTVYKKSLNPSSIEGHGATRCTDSYIVSKKCAKMLCEYIANMDYKIDIPIDHWLNSTMRELDLEIYWAEPTIVSQGTQNGMFKTCY